MQKKCCIPIFLWFAVSITFQKYGRLGSDWNWVLTPVLSSFLKIKLTAGKIMNFIMDANVSFIQAMSDLYRPILKYLAFDHWYQNRAVIICKAKQEQKIITHFSIFLITCILHSMELLVILGIHLLLLNLNQIWHDSFIWFPSTVISIWFLLCCQLLIFKAKSILIVYWPGFQRDDKSFYW